jgi:hypothetical protein
VANMTVAQMNVLIGAMTLKKRCWCGNVVWIEDGWAVISPDGLAWEVKGNFCTHCGSRLNADGTATPMPSDAGAKPLGEWCECAGWRWQGLHHWVHQSGFPHIHCDSGFCENCGSHLNPDGTATPSPLHKPVATEPAQPADTVPPFKPLAKYSILELEAMLEAMPEKLGVAVRLLIIPPSRNYAGFAVTASPLSGVFFADEGDRDTAAREAVAMFLKGMEADCGLPEDLSMLAHSRTD